MKSSPDLSLPMYNKSQNSALLVKLIFFEQFKSATFLLPKLDGHAYKYKHLNEVLTSDGGSYSFL